MSDPRDGTYECGGSCPSGYTLLNEDDKLCWRCGGGKKLRRRPAEEVVSAEVADLAARIKEALGGWSQKKNVYISYSRPWTE